MLSYERAALMGLYSMSEIPGPVENDEEPLGNAALTEIQRCDLSGNAISGHLIIYLLIAWRALIPI